jgi:hypothetical protein
MQSTTRLPEGVTKASPHEAYRVFPHPIAFYTANGVFTTDAERRDRAIGCFLRWGEVTPRRFLLRLDEGDTVEEQALEPPILGEATAMWHGRALQFSQAFSLCLPCLRGTQAAARTARLAHEEVRERGARLLAAVGCLLALGRGGAGERSLRAIRPQRGG